MSYVEEQQEAWLDGGIFWYAMQKKIKIKVDDLAENERDMEIAMKRISRKLGLPLGGVPSDFDHYDYLNDEEWYDD